MTFSGPNACTFTDIRRPVRLFDAGTSWVKAMLVSWGSPLDLGRLAKLLADDEIELLSGFLNFVPLQTSEQLFDAACSYQVGLDGRSEAWDAKA